MMWKVPVKYNTVCYDASTGDPMYSKTLEAIDDDEAEARAYLNCVRANRMKTNARVTVKKA